MIFGKNFRWGKELCQPLYLQGGRQHFIHYTTRMGCRYIQLHISNIQDEFVLYYAGMRPTEYPVQIKGILYSNSLWNKIYDVSIRTLHLCMHEHYEDIPWREQALTVWTLETRLYVDIIVL